ncbi:MAG: hypothetical protein RBT64_00135 [Trichloromonas sp.]|nr:hypothetical protein [Trichloromonas sp.]
MHQHHYDIILLGESLASRIVGVLLAKAGQRVLTFQGKPPADSGRLFAGSHLDRLLDQLGHRQPLGNAPRLHIVSDLAQVELHGRYGLEEELRREFPGDADLLLQLFQRLAALGERLDNQLLEQAGAPLGSLTERLWYRAGHWLLGSTQRSLGQPLSDYFVPFAEESRAWLNILFSGLALAPVAELTLAEGALLWHGLSRPQALEEDLLSGLLSRRYLQFHGLYEPLTKIAALTEGYRLQLHDGRECSAGTLIIGQCEALPPEIAAALPPFRHPRPRSRWDSGPLRPAPSKVMAPRIIHGAPPSLRSSLHVHDGGTHCASESAAEVTRETVMGHLQTLFPFSSPAPKQLKPLADSGEDNPRRGFASFPGTLQNPWLNRNLALCQGSCIFPRLGSIGEILTGYAVAGRLSRGRRK